MYPMASNKTEAVSVCKSETHTHTYHNTGHMSLLRLKMRLITINEEKRKRKTVVWRVGYHKRTVHGVSLLKEINKTKHIRCFVIMVYGFIVFVFCEMFITVFGSDCNNGLFIIFPNGETSW